MPDRALRRTTRPTDTRPVPKRATTSTRHTTACSCRTTRATIGSTASGSGMAGARRFCRRRGSAPFRPPIIPNRPRPDTVPSNRRRPSMRSRDVRPPDPPRQNPPPSRRLPGNRPRTTAAAGLRRPGASVPDPDTDGPGKRSALPLGLGEIHRPPGPGPHTREFVRFMK